MVKESFISIVVPVFNEKKVIEKNVAKLKKRIDSYTKNYEIIIAEDGCTDGTDVLAKKLSESSNKIKHFHYNRKLGRGKALNRAFKKSKGDILAYLDVDLATDLSYLPQLIESITDGADFATGSRIISGADCKRPLKREIASRIYNFLVRLLFNVPVLDMQCGFKAFKRNSLMKLIDEIQDTHWFWDTECFVRGYRKGYKIKEFPVKWTQHTEESKVNVLKDGQHMGTKLIKLWWTLNMCDNNKDKRRK